ncbi:hypothetical protein [Streptomyces sp. NPDC059994]|uniref:hypothetical protein n=1 Tax=Streptomyces sp. NPDC059994 TaxID=3347029 RepID=UPI0036855A76
MARIARNKSSETITTFGPNWFSRREDLNADILLLGGRKFWTPADADLRTDEHWRVWLQTSATPCSVPDSAFTTCSPGAPRPRRHAPGAA